MSTKTGCTCTEPGYCERHGCKKGPGAFRLCQTSQKHFDAWENGGTVEQDSEQHRRETLGKRTDGTQRKNKKKAKLLGTRIKDALTAVGITEERVSSFLGRPCNCAVRVRKLNELDQWFRDSFKKKTKEEAAEDAASIVS